METLDLYIKGYFFSSDYKKKNKIWEDILDAKS